MAVNKWRSKFEARLGEQIKESGVKYKYEDESFNYYDKVPNGVCHSCGEKDCFTERYYTPDFFLENGIILEAKGKFTPANRKKHLAVRELHPELDIRFVFMRDNWLSKKHTIKYSEWCEQHGFEYSVSRIPEEWLNGN